MCRIHKDNFITTLREDSALLRTSDNIHDDYLSHDPRETGIVEQCVWNRITYFTNENNSSVDMMHDVFEGIAGYVFRVVLKGLINKNHCFALPLLNDRIKNFEYGPDRSAKPTPITQPSVGTYTVRMSASEMRNFVLYFGLMVGHLVQIDDYDPFLTDNEDEDEDEEDAPPVVRTGRLGRPRGTSSQRAVPKSRPTSSRGHRGRNTTTRPHPNDDARVSDAAEYYKLYLLLNEVIAAASVDSVNRLKAYHLADVVEMFLKTYVRLAGDEGTPAKLQPKFHFLTHYPSMMLKHGPLPALSCFRFESKNKQLKTGLKNSFNNINTPLSAAKKEQFHLNYLFFHNVIPERRHEYGKLNVITDQSEIDEVSFVLRLDPDLIRLVKFVDTKESVRFCPGYVVCFQVDSRGLPEFAKIVKIYVDIRTNEPYVKCQHYVTHMYSTHFRAYEVTPVNYESYFALSSRQYCFPNTHVKALNGCDYIVMRNCL